MKKPFTVLSIVVALMLVGASVATGLPIKPYPAAPLCATHDALVYHGLWNSELGCHYDHTHGDDPHAVDDIFGTDWLTQTGGDIETPWRTDGENHVNHKHESYLWLVRRDNPPVSPPGANVSGFVKAYRVQVHGDLHNNVSTLHSYRAELQVCLIASPDNCGIVRMGGHQWVGDMFIDGVCVIDLTSPVTGTPQPAPPVRLHYNIQGQRTSATWYQRSPRAWVTLAVESQDMWAYFTASAPTAPVFNCAIDGAGFPMAEGCRWNQSYIQPHVIGFTIPAKYRLQLGLTGNNYNYSGFVDRYGNPVAACAPLAVDCIPLVFENVPGGAVLFQTNSEYREYDFIGGLFPATGSGWIEYPHAP